MAEKPIIFSTNMVRAILNGQKTQTRRPVKSENPPYKPGDILWVRETWAINDLSLKSGTLREGDEAWFYKGRYKSEFKDKVVYAADYSEGSWQGAWRPSIHMPRAAARLFLKVTDVRVQKLQDISKEDAIKEGIWATSVHGWLLDRSSEWCRYTLIAAEDQVRKKPHVADEIGGFALLWDRMYKKRGYGWKDNPWVWVIEFEKKEDAK